MRGGDAFFPNDFGEDLLLFCVAFVQQVLAVTAYYKNEQKLLWYKCWCLKYFLCLSRHGKYDICTILCLLHMTRQSMFHAVFVISGKLLNFVLFSSELCKNGWVDQSDLWICLHVPGSTIFLKWLDTTKMGVLASYHISLLETCICAVVCLFVTYDSLACS